MCRKNSDMTDPYPIRPTTESDFDLYALVNQHAFNHGPLPAEARARTIRMREFPRTLGAFDGSQIVGTAGAYSFQFSVPGTVMPGAGVTMVSVLPTYRRRGILRSLMLTQLADIAARGTEPIAVLWASEAVLYGRYGYGMASSQLAFRFLRGEGALSAAVPRDPSLTLSLVSPSGALPSLKSVYTAVLESRPGLFSRSDLWWERRLYDPESERGGKSPLRCLLASSDSGPAGYALYTSEGRWDDVTFLPYGSLEVRELMASDPAAGAALWSNLLDRDLITSATSSLRPADDPLRFQLADPRRLRPALSDGVWVRLIDLPAALTGRSYSAPVDVVLDVRDAQLPANAARWRLTAPGVSPAASGASAASPASGTSGTSGTSGARCERVSDMPDISLDVSTLGAAYLGGTSLGTLAAAGLVTEHRPGAVLALSAAMSWSPAPWCPMIF
jgi:predicted acetyltransferase